MAQKPRELTCHGKLPWPVVWGCFWVFVCSYTLKKEWGKNPNCTHWARLPCSWKKEDLTVVCPLNVRRRPECCFVFVPQATVPWGHCPCTPHTQEDSRSAAGWLQGNLAGEHIHPRRPCVVQGQPSLVELISFRIADRVDQWRELPCLLLWAWQAQRLPFCVELGLWLSCFNA